MATRQQLKDALLKADAAGDTESAELFADYLREGKYSDKISRTGAALQGIGQGGTFGFGDEAAAGLRALAEQAGIGPGMYALGELFGGGMESLRDPAGVVSGAADVYRRTAQETDPGYGERGFGEAYEAALEDQRGEVKRAFGERPGYAFTGALAGGAATGGAGLGKTVAGQTFRQALPAVMRTGAGYGALAGLGGSEQSVVGAAQELGEGDPTQATDLALDVAAGGALGGVLAPAIPAIGTGLRNVGGRLLPQRMRAGERARAQVLTDLNDDLKAAGLTRIDAEEMLQSNPNMTVADLGDNLRALSQNVVNSPGPGGAAFKEFLEDRARDQSGRIMPELAGALRAQTKNFGQAMSNLITRRKETASALYDEAFALPTRITPRMEALMKLPSGRAAQKGAQALSAEEGRTFAPAIGQMRKTEDINSVLRGWQQHVDKLFRMPGKGDLARRAKANLEEFEGLVYQQRPELRAARAQWRGDKADEEALQLGTGIFNEFADVTREQVKKMSFSERSQFKIGAMRAIERKLKGKKDYQDIVSDLADNAAVRDSLRLAFGGRGKFDRFMKLLQDEKRFQETATRALTGSKTQANMAKQAEVSGGRIGNIIGLVFGAKVGLPPFLAGGIGGQIGRQIAGRQTGNFQRAQNEAMANLLQGRSIQPLAPPTGLRGGLLSDEPTLMRIPAGVGAAGGLLGSDL